MQDAIFIYSSVGILSEPDQSLSPLGLKKLTQLHYGCLQHAVITSWFLTQQNNNKNISKAASYNKSPQHRATWMLVTE